jgi:hypothetical protein
MKITDKMRLDWLQKSSTPGYERRRMVLSNGVLMYATEMEPSRNVRQAIDAAIRAGERNKI